MEKTKAKTSSAERGQGTPSCQRIMTYLMRPEESLIGKDAFFT